MSSPETIGADQGYGTGGELFQQGTLTICQSATYFDQVRARRDCAVERLGMSPFGDAAVIAIEGVSLEHYEAAF